MEQALPNDLLRLIFVELDSVRFILRKVPKISKVWRYWPHGAISELKIHPRYGYKYLMPEIYQSIIRSPIIYTGVKRISIPNELSSEITKLLLKFPNVERVKLMNGESSARIQLPLSDKIKELDLGNDVFVSFFQENEAQQPPCGQNLEVFRSAIDMDDTLFNYLPSSLKELHFGGNAYHVLRDLTKFTALRALSLTCYRVGLAEYLATKPSTLTALTLRAVDADYTEAICNLPTLKSLKVTKIEELYWSDMVPKLSNLERLELEDTNGLIDYDTTFFKNNTTLQSMRLGFEASLFELNPMENLKELRLQRRNLSATVFNRIFAMKRLEKLHLEGAFPEDNKTSSSLNVTNNTLVELTLDGCDNLQEFFRHWADRITGLKKVTFSSCSMKGPIYSTYMKAWKNIQKLNFATSCDIEGTCYFSEMPNLRKFYGRKIVVDETFFNVLAKSPKLEKVLFTLDSNLSSALMENKLYAFLKDARSLYDLQILSHFSFTLVKERVGALTSPQLTLRIYLISRQNRNTIRVLY